MNFDLRSTCLCKRKLGQDSAWMEDLFVAPGSAGMCSDFDADLW